MSITVKRMTDAQLKIAREQLGKQIDLKEIEAGDLVASGGAAFIISLIDEVLELRGRVADGK